MKFEIVVEGEKKEIELKGLKGRDVDELFDAMVEVESSESPGKSAKTFIEKVKQKTVQLSGLTLEQLDDLDSEDRHKLMGYVTQKVTKNLDFIKSSTN